MGNQVTLTFAGDDKQLGDSFARVGKASKEMGDSVGRNVEGIGSTVGRGAAIAGASIGATMAPALAAALAGGVVLAIGGGFLAAGIMGAAKSPQVKSAFGEVGKTGQAALASFSKPFEGPLIRAAGTFAKAIKSMQPTLNEVGKTLAPLIDKLAPALAQMAQNALPGIADAAKQSAPAFEAIAGVLPAIGTWIGDVVTKMAEFAEWGIRNADTIGTIIEVAAPLAGILLGVVAAIKIWTIAQAALNVVLALNPIGLIIIGIAALIAVIVLIYKRTDWFQKAWRASWDWIKKAASNTWDFLKKIPGWIGSAFRAVANFITAPFRTAFNMVARAWNSTIGRLSWTVPGWIPGIGGNTISAPRLPTFHAGGIIPGVPGTPTPILALAGERVSSTAANAGGGGREEWLRVDLGDLGTALLDTISRAVNRRGGGVTALGVRVVNGTVKT